MAEYIYTVDKFSLNSTITYGDFGSEVTSLSSGSTNMTFPTSDLVLAEGESITQAILTADYYMSSGSSSGDEVVKVNGLNFDGTCQLDVSEFVEGQNWGVSFYFCLAYKALGDNALTVESLSVTKTMSFNNVKLTIMTNASAKTSNVYYYDGTKWLSAIVKYYNGSEWVEVVSPKYYDGTQWLGNE